MFPQQDTNAYNSTKVAIIDAENIQRFYVFPAVLDNLSLKQLIIIQNKDFMKLMNCNNFFHTNLRVCFFNSSIKT